MKKNDTNPTAFHLVKKVLFGTLTAAFVLSPGCNCGGEEEPAKAKLTITTPADSATVSVADDEDPFTDGIQVTVSVKVEDEVEGQPITEVSLTNDQSEGSSTKMKVNDGTATFVGVTILSSEAGTANQLTVSAEGATSDNVTVTGSITASSCSITAPSEGDTIDTDADAVAAGFQLAVSAACTGDSLSPSAPVELVVNDSEVLQGTLSSGAVTFRPTIAASGNTNLMVRLKDEPNVNATVTVNVQVPVVGDAPYCTFTAPENNSTVSTDADANTAGFQFGASITCGGVLSTGVPVSGQNIRVSFNGSAPVTAALVNGEGSLQFTATTEGSNQTLSVELEDDASVSNSIAFTILIPCEASFIAPSGEQLLLNGTDDDANTSLEGFQLNVSVGSANCANNSNAEVTLSVSNSDGDTTLPAKGFTASAADFSDVTLAEGTNTITATVGTGVSTGEPVSITVVVDSNAPSNATVSNAAACGDATFADGCINLSNSTNTATDSFVEDLILEVDAEGGVCTSLATPTLKVLGGDSDGVETLTPETVDDTTGAVWALDSDNGKCRATFAAVVLDATTASPDGETVALEFTVADLAANSITLAYSLGIDVQAPTLTIANDMPTEGASYNADKDDDPDQEGQQVGVELSAAVGLADGATLSFLFNGQPATTETYSAQLMPPNTTDGITGMITIASDGTHTVAIQASDRAGNVGTSAAVSFTIDVTAPEVESVDFAIDANNDGVVTLAENNGNQNTVFTNLTILFNEDAVLEDGSPITVNNSAGGQKICYVAEGGATCYGITLSQGSQTFTISAVDTAGNTVNTDTVSAALVLNVDTVPPPCEFTAPAENGQLLTVIGPTADKNFPNLGDGVQVDFVVSLDDSANGVTTPFQLKDNGNIIADATISNGQVTFVEPALAQGDHSFTVDCQDLVGNTASTDPYTFTVDTVVPTVSLSWLLNGSAQAFGNGQVFNKGSHDADTGLAGFQLVFRVGYENVDENCPSETDGNCKIKLYTESQQSTPTVAPVDANQSFVDLTLSYNANSASEKIWAETYDANGNLGQTAQITVSIEGLVSYGCDATITNIGTICGGDGICNAADDADSNASGFQTVLNVSSDDCANPDGGDARTLALKVRVNDQTDFVTSFTAGAGTVSEDITVTIPDGVGVSLRASIEEAGLAAGTDTQSIDVDTVAASGLSLVTFENNTQGALSSCAFDSTKSCFDASSGNASGSDSDYSRGFAILTDIESGSCDRLGTPTLTVDSGTAISGSTWSAVNGSSQCRSSFSDAVLVPGNAEPDDTAGNIALVVVDTAGNSAELSVDWVVDRQAPTLSLTGPAQSDVGALATYTVAHSNLDAGQAISLYSQTLGLLGTADAASDSDASIGVTFFSSSTQNLWVEATDRVGNSTSTVSNLTTTEVDCIEQNGADVCTVVVGCSISSLSALSPTFASTVLSTTESNSFNPSDDHQAGIEGLQGYLVAVVDCGQFTDASGILTVAVGGTETTVGVAHGQTLNLQNFNLPEGSNDLDFTIAVGGVDGATTSYPIVVDTAAPAGLSAGWVKNGTDTAFNTCGTGFADHCMLAGAETSSVSAFVHTLYVTVNAENDACPFDAPVLTLPSGALNGSAFELTGGTCRSSFDDVTLSDTVSPDGETVAVSLSVTDSAGNIATWAATEEDNDGITLGLDVVAPSAVLTVNDSSAADHSVVGAEDTTLTVNYVVTAAGNGIEGQTALLYVNDTPQPSQTVDGNNPVNTFSVQYTSDGTRAVYATVADASGNISNSNIINTTVTGYNSPLCNASITSIAGSADLSAVIVTSNVGESGSSGWRVPVVVAASKSLSSGNYSCTNDAIVITVKDANGAITYTDNSSLIGGDSTGTAYAELPQGSATITAEVIHSSMGGLRDTESVTTDTEAPVPNGLMAMVGDSSTAIPACYDETFADYCFTTAIQSDSDTDYQKTLQVSVSAENGACPYGTPEITVADAASVSGGAWSLQGQNCLAEFTDLVLMPGATRWIDDDQNNYADDGTNPPDDDSVAVELTLTDTNNNTLVTNLTVGIDMVSPVVFWGTVDTVVNAGADYQADVTGAQAKVNITLKGMGGSVATLLNAATETPLADWVEQGSPTGSATCSPDLYNVDGTIKLLYGCTFFANFSSEGSFNLRVGGKDRAGNDIFAYGGLARDFLIDTEVPVIGDIVIAGDNVPKGTVNLAENGDSSGDFTTDVGVSFTIDGSVEAGQTATLNVSSIVNNNVQSQTIDATTATGVGNLVRVDFEDVVLANGTHTITVEVSDQAGNAVDSTTNTKTLIVDTVAPDCSIISERHNPLLISPQSGAVHDSEPSLAGLQYEVQVDSDSDNASIVLANGDTVVATADSAAGYNGGSSTFPGTTAGLTFEQGNHSLNVTCTDSAGNIRTSNVDATGSCADNACCNGTCFGDADDNYAFFADPVAPLMLIQGDASCGTQQNPCTGGTGAGQDDCLGGVDYTCEEPPVNVEAVACCSDTENLSTHPNGSSASSDYGYIQRTYQILYANITAGQKIYLLDEEKENGIQLCNDEIGLGGCVGWVTVPTTSTDDDYKQLEVMVRFTQAGSHLVKSYAIDQNGNSAFGETYNFIIDTGFHSVTLNSPSRTGTGGRQIGLTEDTDPGTEGAQVLITATTDAPEGSNATLFVGTDPGDDTALTQGETVTVASDGSISFSATTFNNGTAGYFEIEVDSTNIETPGKSGTSGAYPYTVDLVAPSVSFSSPAITAGMESYTIYLHKNAPENVNDSDNQTLTGLADTDTGTPGYQGSFAVDWSGCGLDNALSISQGESLIASTTIASDSPATLSISLGSTGIADADGVTITASCLDEAGNTGSASFTANVDTVAPTTDLSVSVASGVDAVRQGEVTLNFTGPGDDGFVGDIQTALEIVAQSGSEPTVGLFSDSNAAVSGVSSTGAGQSQTATVSPYAFDNTWYFMIRAKDDVGNVSNVTTGSVSLALNTAILDDDEGTDSYGTKMAAKAGDIDGDQKDDLIFSRYDTKEVMVAYGSSDLSSLTAVGVASDTGNTLFSAAINMLSSINGDALADWGSTSKNGTTGKREVEIFYGSASRYSDGATLTPSLRLALNNTNNIRYFSSVGDVNGDTHEDMVIATSKNAYIVLGPFSDYSGAVCLSTTACDNADVYSPLPAGRLVEIAGLPDGSDFSDNKFVSGLGDVDLDGYADFALGSEDYGDNGVIVAVYGRASWDATVDPLTDGDTTILTGACSTKTITKLGALIHPGNFNGDDKMDMYVAGKGVGQGGIVYLASSNGTFSDAQSASNCYDVNYDSLSLSGSVATVPGDVNGDGLSDIAAATSSGFDVFFGSTNVNNRGVIATSYSTQLTGHVASEYAKTGVAGDLDGDGFYEMVFARYKDGRVWVVYGSP